MSAVSYIESLRDNKVSNCLEHAKTIAIAGHIHPDGDCVGACTALCTFILDNYPDKTVDIYIDPIQEVFTFLKNSDRICQKEEKDTEYDLCISLDCSDIDRLNQGGEVFAKAGYTVCIDHHITNQGFGDEAYIYPKSSSTCEVLYYLFTRTELFGQGKVSYDCAQSLYVGIIHDTGVFKHNNTTKEAMMAAAELVDFGLNTEKIIDETFYEKTYRQNQILGKALLESMLMLDGRMIFSVLYQKDFELFGVDSSDFDGIIDQLRVTKGVQCAVFLYEKEENIFKVSMRSNDDVNVSKIAMEFGGGGHIKAAGCTMEGQMRDIVMNIAQRVEYQLSEKDADTSIHNVIEIQEENL